MGLDEEMKHSGENEITPNNQNSHSGSNNSDGFDSGTANSSSEGN